MSTQTRGRSLQSRYCLPNKTLREVIDHFRFFSHLYSPSFTYLICLPLTILMLASVADLRAQTSSCNCPAYINVGSDNTLTDYDNITAFNSSRCYFISGTLVINGNDPQWNNIRIKMDEAAEILVESGLTMSNTYISGCGVMWKGIRTDAITNLNVYNCVIEDANFGMLLATWTGFHCENTDFINDYIGIAVGDPFHPVEFDVQIQQRGPVFGCRFFTHTVLPPPYPGHYYEEGWPESSFIPYDKGFAAVYIAGAAGLNIGFVGATGTDRNQIYQMRNGVIMQYAVADIAGTDFYNFYGWQRPGITDPLLDLNQYGIHAYFVTSSVEDNTMENLITGIKATDASHKIYGNTIELLTADALVSQTRGMDIFMPQILNIENNEIINGYYGIRVTAATTSFNIKSNVLTRQLTAGHNTGIAIVGSLLPDLTRATIKNNIITIYDGKETFGIHIDNSQRVTVDANNVQYLEDEEAGNTNRGISIDGSNTCYVSRNDVEAVAAYKSALSDNMGVEFSYSNLNTLHCNSFLNFETNIRILGPNVTTRLTSNSIFTALRGLVLTGNVAIGTQNQYNNTWDGNTYSIWGAFIDSPDPDLVAAQSRFFVNTNIDPDYEPDPIGPSVIDNGSWFTIAPSSPTFACVSPGPNPVANPDTLQKLLETTFAFEDYNDQTIWLIKADIFEMMMLDPSLSSNTVLDSFFEEEETNALGKLVTWQLGLNARYGVQAAEKELTQDTIWTFSRDLVYIDSIIAEKPSDSMTWLSLRELKVDSLTTKTQVLYDLLETENDESLEAYEDIADGLSSLSTSNDLEEYFRIALFYKAKLLIGTTLAGSDSSYIYDMTQLCPWEAGRAVGIAQELYASLMDSSLVATLENCETSSPFKIQPGIETPHTAPSVSVTPNPSNGEIRIQGDSQIREVIVTNANQQKISNFNPHDKRASLHLGNLPSGMYLITVLTDMGIFTQRISIIN